MEACPYWSKPATADLDSTILKSSGSTIGVHRRPLCSTTPLSPSSLFRHPEYVIDCPLPTQMHITAATGTPCDSSAMEGREDRQLLVAYRDRATSLGRGHGTRPGGRPSTRWGIPTGTGVPSKTGTTCSTHVTAGLPAGPRCRRREEGGLGRTDCGGSVS